MLLLSSQSATITVLPSAESAMAASDALPTSKTWLHVPPLRVNTHANEEALGPTCSVGAPWMTVLPSAETATAPPAPGKPVARSPHPCWFQATAVTLYTFAEMFKGATNGKRSNGYAVQYRPVVSMPGLKYLHVGPYSRIAHPSRNEAPRSDQ